MKKYAFLLFAGVLFSVNVYAEDAQPQAPASDARTESSQDASQPSDSSEAVSPAPDTAAPVTDATPMPMVDAAAAPAAGSVEAPPAPEAPATPENLEFVSGEISAVSEEAKTITVKLYGETEESASDKILTIKLDENTDITDGEKDRDLKSLAVGTEVDVEYDSVTTKATYIFVY